MNTTEDTTANKIVGDTSSQSLEENARKFACFKSSAFRKNFSGFRKYQSALLVVILAVFSAGCFSSEQGETFYGRVAVRPKQELRWSDGGLPRTFDPALAAAAPDTDVVRALFEGLTEYDPRTLATKPAAAERWESSENDRVWTFHLRANARWSNGDPLVAADFVRAWERAIRLGERVPHRALLADLHTPTLRTDRAAASSVQVDVEKEIHEKLANPNKAGEAATDNEPRATATPESGATLNRETLSPTKANAGTLKRRKKESSFGAEAVSMYVLRVRLARPDPNFHTLVAHTLFRPLHAGNLKAEVPAASHPSAASIFDNAQRKTEGAISETADTDQSLADAINQDLNESPAGQAFVNPRLSNGAFQLANRSASEVVLTRANTYWNRDAVKLEAVRFMPTTNLETTLAQYRAGEIDVISNAPFEPLTIKLLAPHEDFRRTTFGALNYYVFNRNVAPFDDRRVREAFALAVDRGRLARDVLGGATEAAQEFLPLEARVRVEGNKDKNVSVVLRTNQQRARQLLAEAGYKQGTDFPVVRLLINRSATHRSVAQAVAAMWRDTLGVKTELVVKDWRDYETALASGDFTIARRSIVMQTPDEQRILEAMFDNSLRESLPNERAIPDSSATTSNATNTDSSPADVNIAGTIQPAAAPSPAPSTNSNSTQLRAAPAVVSHEQAMRELPGIPLYFASSFALVKPYVFDFEQNLLDAPSLKSVSINQEWTPSSESQRITVDTP